MTIFHQAEAVESVESELETAKDRLRKNVEAVDGINKSILVFESRHVETVERMKEVRFSSHCRKKCANNKIRFFNGQI